ncbi:low temperature requirement protein A [Croceibacterium selenioxidans]|uniref:low temperature requirement protein A n=1 Tax=Croceibacterium selenioxidans TaxID=2838833 RepID=UPI002032333B|nr:low temperature requirement protein A [Croceibacterium selenioxidans]
MRDQNGHVPVSYLELFFDLVFVFALTQISHLILETMSWQGLAEAAIAFSAVWLAWIYTTWAANWAEPERLPVRIMLICVMLASLIMAVVLPHAFEDKGLIFALSYVAIQVGRTLFMVYVMYRSEGGNARNMLRIAIWFMTSAVVWIAGALLAEGWDRFWWWLAALAIEYAGPFALFRLPFLGRSTLDDWSISGHHLAERCALFIIIALGEGIVVTGGTFAGQAFTATNLTAFLIAFSGSVLMWWIYFDTGARRGSDRIEHHSQPGRVARDAYTYLHMPIVMGIIGGAVADEMLLAHPDHHASRALVAFTCGGMALYLLGVGQFKKGSSTHLRFPLSHLAGLSLFGWLATYAWLVPLPALLFGSLGVAVLLLVAVWEWFSLHGGWQERLERWRKKA